MPQNGQPNGASASDDERLLDSWKEIASYLGRSVRTVQMWEKNEGLPVHRHQHQNAGTVYAYASEIDAWRESRDPLTSTGVGPVAPSFRTFWRGVAAAVTVMLALIGWWMLSIHAPPPWQTSKTPPASAKRDWLLISNFENRTGEEIFDGTL